MVVLLLKGLEEGVSFWGFSVDGRLASLVLLVGNRRPGCIGVETFHLLELVQGLRSKILLVDYAVVADYEGPHTR